MAQQFGLAFLPTVIERFDLAVDRHAWFEPPFQRLLAFCATPAYATKAAELGGYDLSGHGRVVWNAPCAACRARKSPRPRAGTSATADRKSTRLNSSHSCASRM